MKQTSYAYSIKYILWMLRFTLLSYALAASNIQTLLKQLNLCCEFVIQIFGVYAMMKVNSDIMYVVVAM